MRQGQTWLHHDDLHVVSMCRVSTVLQERVKAFLTTEPVYLNACGLLLTNRTYTIEHL